MQDSWPGEAEHLGESSTTEEAIDIPVFDGASAVDLPLGAGCAAVCHILPNTPSTETVLTEPPLENWVCCSCNFSFLDQFIGIGCLRCSPSQH